MRIVHDIPPVFDGHSRVLVLGSFPSVRSRGNFFYHHPQNRFWKVLAALFGEGAPETVAEKKALLLRHGVALWDVIAECDVTGSSDASIRNAVPNDLAPILQTARIGRVFTNGATAHALYRKFLAERVPLPETQLPSTSPANAAWSLERLIEAWRPVAEEAEKQEEK